jgi:hypothetical protein
MFAYVKNHKTNTIHCIYNNTRYTLTVVNGNYRVTKVVKLNYL